VADSRALPSTTETTRQIPLWLASAALWTTVGLALLARHTIVPALPWLSTFGVIFASIVVEALPFILLGAGVSAAMAVFVPRRVFERIGALPRGLQLPGAALAGVAFPVCECGSVPVARRLIERGVAPAAGIAFMLAAPILNPIVVASTWVAYGGGRRGAEMAAARCGVGLIVAMAAGLALARGGASLLRSRGPGGEDDVRDHAPRPQAFVAHLVGDFTFMGRFLILGAALSALLQTVVPQTIISGLADQTVLATLALMALAFMLSLCSEADAFVATSFTSFPLASQLGFLVLGPVADTKLAVLYGATFRDRFAARLLLVAVPLTLAGSLLAGALIS
jgi:uncharacterized membrane protein YraQ (UPF0718 family)